MSKRSGAASSGTHRQGGMGHSPQSRQGRVRGEQELRALYPPDLSPTVPVAGESSRMRNHDESRSYMAAEHNVIHVSNARRSAAACGAIL